MPKACRRAALVLAALLGGCAGPNVDLKQLLTLPVPADTGSTGSIAASPTEPHQTALTVDGTPTGIFAQVARGAIGCWFAADGPLKATHIYRAEAEPPAKGGDAEIVIYVRDPKVRDLRGPRAYWINFTADGAGVRVATTASRFELKVAQAMAQDVQAWAKAGESCHLRAALPPPEPQVAAKPAKPAKAAKTAKGQASADKKR